MEIIDLKDRLSVSSKRINGREVENYIIIGRGLDHI